MVIVFTMSVATCSPVKSRASSSPSALVVWATNRRLTVDLEADRAVAWTAAPTGSPAVAW
jgi:hypothetical protein